MGPGEGFLINMASPSLAIVDYGSSNIQSVKNALSRIGVDVRVAMTAADLAEADGIVLPGVGSFAKAMSNLNESGVRDALEIEVIVKQKPFLGICLGMQLLAKHSDEGGHTDGLGWLDAEVVHLQHTRTMNIPHTGWTYIDTQGGHTLFQGIPADRQCFYFVHSYAVRCADNIVLATCQDDSSIVAALGQGNILGTQFHPEKSAAAGCQLLANFRNSILQDAGDIADAN